MLLLHPVLPLLIAFACLFIEAIPNFVTVFYLVCYTSLEFNKEREIYLSYKVMFPSVSWASFASCLPDNILLLHLEVQSCHINAIRNPTQNFEMSPLEIHDSTSLSWDRPKN